MAANDLTVIERMKGEGNVEGLVGALRDPDEAIRRAAIEALVTIADPRTPDLVMPLVSDPDLEVRAAALEAGLRARARWTQAQPAPKEPTWWQKLALHTGLFMAGAVAWTLALLFLGLMFSFQLAGVLVLLQAAIALAPIGFLSFLSIKGWNVRFVDKRGDPSTLYKVAVYFMFLFAGFGLLLSCYWTGKSLLRWYVNKQL